jgi:fructokinase
MHAGGYSTRPAPADVGWSAGMFDDQYDAARPVAVGVGEVLWDLLPGGKQLGGAPANFAYHAQQLGARATIISAVGHDTLGDEILARLAELNIDTSFVTVDGTHPTGTVSVKLDAAGVPSYVIHEDVAWDFLRCCDAAYRLRSDIICFGSLAQRNRQSRAAIQDILDHTGRLKIFDINLRQHYYNRPVIEESLDLADVLKINDEEVATVTCLFDLNSFADVRRMLFDRYALDLIAVTRGAKGSVLYPRDGESAEHPGTPATKLVDTVGAGDAFTAALAVGLWRKEPLDRINAAANRLAAFVCTQPGATPPIPAELRASLWETTR